MIVGSILVVSGIVVVNRKPRATTEAAVVAAGK
jgi:hypothetical protein